MTRIAAGNCVRIIMRSSLKATAKHIDIGLMPNAGDIRICKGDCQARVVL